MRGPIWGFPFHIHIYVFNYAIGRVLSQKGVVEHAIYFITKNLYGAEFNYTVTKKKFLAIIYRLSKFKHYIIFYEIFVHTNHSTIKYLINTPTISRRLARWLLLVQEFDITIVDKPSKDNVVAT